MERVDRPIYIYADNAATTRLSDTAREAMLPYLGGSFGNPGGIHRYARAAAEAVAGARAACATCLGANPREIFFTSGGTESDVWALSGCARAARLAGAAAPTVITSAIEHHAVLNTCKILEQDGCRIIVLPVDTEGFVSPADLEAALVCAAEDGKADGGVLVSIMYANNEVGTVQDIAALCRIAHTHGALFHTDAVQAAGHIPCKVDELGVDLLSASGHKFHSPTGTGLLYIRSGTPIAPLITGGAQQSGMRAGTENVAAIVGMAAALQEAIANMDARAARVDSARCRITNAVLAACPGVIATGPRDSARRLPSIASFICPDVDAELLMVILDQDGIAAATGSACSAGSTEPSHVTAALGYTEPALAKGTLRLSLADDITEAESAYLCEHVPACIRRAQATSGGNLRNISLFSASA